MSNRKIAIILIIIIIILVATIAIVNNNIKNIRLKKSTNADISRQLDYIISDEINEVNEESINEIDLNTEQNEMIIIY